MDYVAARAGGARRSRARGLWALASPPPHFEEGQFETIARKAVDRLEALQLSGEITPRQRALHELAQQRLNQPGIDPLSPGDRSAAGLTPEHMEDDEWLRPCRTLASR